jgi:hypothetical protein
VRTIDAPLQTEPNRFGSERLDETAIVKQAIEARARYGRCTRPSRSPAADRRWDRAIAEIVRVSGVPEESAS